MNNLDLKNSDGRKPKRNIAYLIGEGLGLVACVCVAAIVITLTVKLIMWIL